MSRCHRCQREFVAEDHVLPAVCPACRSAAHPAPADGGWTAIAKLKNLAEVGYFCDLLERAGIAVDVADHDEFSAITGVWERTFFIRTPAHQRDAVLARLEAGLTGEAESDEEVVIGDELERPTGRAAMYASGGEPFADAYVSTSGGAGWIPVALALVAGGLAGWMGRDLATARASRQPSLWQALEETERPIINPPSVRGAPHGRVRFDPGRRSIFLDEDTDGDGRYDRSREFRREGLVAPSER